MSPIPIPSAVKLMVKGFALPPVVCLVGVLTAYSFAVGDRSGSACAAPSGQAGFEDWYPADIRPPAGTRYHCNLTALPRAMPGIPEADRRFINHVYAMILRLTQYKLVMLAALDGNRDVDSAYSTYYAGTVAALGKLKAEAPPAGLAKFKDDVVSAVVLQVNFFNKGRELRKRGASMQDVYGIEEGRAASTLLFAAWDEMVRRYPAWSAETKDSIYHHLCAFDLF